MKKLLTTLLLAAALAGTQETSNVFVVGASDWANFRGPSGTGISPDQRLPDELSLNRNVVWKQKTPKGHSSPIVAGGRVWITGHEGDARNLLCYDAGDGSLIWRRAIPKSRSDNPNPKNGPATPTPVSDGRSVFVFFPEIGLVAYSFDGKQRWLVPLGPFSAVNGMSASPVYAEGNVVLLVDTPDDAYLAAFDAATGKQVWRTDRKPGFEGSYATPVVYRPAEGPPQIIVSGAEELAAYQAKTGKRLWWALGVTLSPAANPVVGGDSVFTVDHVRSSPPSNRFRQNLKLFDKNNNGKIEVETEVPRNSNDYRWLKSISRYYGKNDGVVTGEDFDRAFDVNVPGGGLVCTRLGGIGNVSKTHVVWRYTKGIHWIEAPLFYNNILYILRTGGILSTFDPKSGQLLREERIKDALGEYMSQMVAGDGKIYVISQEGKVTVLRAGADWEKLSSGELGEEVIATPAIAASRIYVRTEETLYCFAAKK